MTAMPPTLPPDRHQAAVAEALTWLGTPWHHEGGVKGAGVDCAMLLVRVFGAVGLIPDIDPRPYPIDHMLHSPDERFLGWLQRYATEVLNVTTPRPGDVLIYKVGRCFSHAAIVTQWPCVVHAFRDERAVVLSRFDVGRLASRTYKVMRIDAPDPHTQTHTPTKVLT
jgi:cell wall-associated NlpC family hydrolase